MDEKEYYIERGSLSIGVRLDDKVNMVSIGDGRGDGSLILLSKAEFFTMLSMMNDASKHIESILIKIEQDTKCPECGNRVTIKQEDSMYTPGGHCGNCNKHVFAFFDIKNAEVIYRALDLTMMEN